MAASGLHTYLNDHHAGARGALTLLASLIDLEPGRRDWLSQLHAEIEADRQTLTTIMERLQIAPSVAKQVSGWLGERVTTLKLTLESPDRAFHLMQAFEVLSLGILGKDKLWVSLESIASDHVVLGELDFVQLRSRAASQHDRVERARLAEAARALSAR